MNRRNFFMMLGAAMAALGFKEPGAKADLTQQIHDGLDLNHAAWGPGVKHPHWRVPQGRWVVDDPDKALEWPKDVVLEWPPAEPLANSPDERDAVGQKEPGKSRGPGG